MIQSHAKKDKRPKRLCLRLFVFFYMASIPHEQKESTARCGFANGELLQHRHNRRYQLFFTGNDAF